MLPTISSQSSSLAQSISLLLPSPPATPTPSPLMETPPSTLPTTTPSSKPEPKPHWLLSTLSRDAVVRLMHHEGVDLPSVCPCDPANKSDTKTHWTSEELHRIIGCRKFQNYKHLILVSRNGEWLDGGEFPPSLGSYATIRKANSGVPLDQKKYKYLDAVHMDIAFRDCLLDGGVCYVLILVNRATRYNWAFGLKNLSPGAILSAIQLFCSAAGSLSQCFYCDCGVKLFGTTIREYLSNNQSKVVAAPAKRQSSNGLVKSHWKTMVHMAWAYLTEKQMLCMFWFYTVVHLARMMNAIPGTISSHLALPFLLVHGVGHDEQTWIPLFSIWYFHHEKDSDQQWSQHQVNTMDGIGIGRSPTSNALLVYNPRNGQYYKPDSYRIDPYRLPTSIYANNKYDSGLFCHLLQDNNPHMEEKSPQGHMSNNLTPPWISSFPAQWWISHSWLLFCLLTAFSWIWITPFSSTTAPPPAFLSKRSHHSFLLLLLVLSLEIHPCLKIPSSHHFFVSSQRSHINGMGNITRVISLSGMAPTFSLLSHTSASAPKTGALTCLISPWIGLIFALKVFLSPVIYPTCFYIPCHPRLLQPLIQSTFLSVWSTFTSNSHLPFLKALPVPTLTR
jgi:hypothetical protein